MSATELIQQVSALPPREKILFEELFQAMKQESPPTIPASPPHWPDFASRLKTIYGNTIAPDSQPIISEGRGDY
jgi:hypothetical protein